MNRVLKCFVVGLGALLIGNVAMAVTIPDGIKVQAQYGGKPIVLTSLQSFESSPNEDEVTFLKRVGVFMQTYSHENKVETCASIWKNSKTGAYALQVFTSNAHTGCVLVTENPKNNSDWVKEDDTVHSHPVGQDGVVLNEADSVLTGEPVGTKKVLFNATFSQEDKDAGPGFLIANRHLQYQKDGGKYYKDYGSLN
jgi:hypothetical protein